MSDIEDDLIRRKRDDTPLRVVVVALTFSGHSDPNTVCSGACKGALMHIGEILETEFADARAAAKGRLAARQDLRPRLQQVAGQRALHRE